MMGIAALDGSDPSNAGVASDNGPSIFGALDAIAGQCALVRHDGLILQVNADWRAFARANGYRSSEADQQFGVGTNYLGICQSASGAHSDGANCVVDGLQAVLEGRTGHFEYEYPCHSLTEKRWFKCLARALPAGDATKRLALVQHVDVTDQVVRRLSAESRRQRLQEHSEALGLHWWRLDADQQTITFSIGLSESLGVSSNVAHPLDIWRSKLAGEDQAVFDRSVEQVLRAGASVETFSFNLSGPDEQLRRLTCLGWRNTDGDAANEINGVAVDVTDQWLAKEALTEFDRRLRSLIEAMPIRLASLDRSLRYRYVNDAFADGVGRAKEDIEGMSADEVLGPAVWGVVEPLVRQALEGEVSSIEADTVMSDGSPLHAIITYIPDVSSTGRVDGVFAVVQDVAELKRRETELRNAMEAAEAASRAKSDFLACMSHELRTPLNGIIGFAELLADARLGVASAQQVHEYSGFILSSGTHLLEMVNGLLDLSAIEVGRFVVETALIDIRPIIEDSDLTIRRKAEEKGIDLSTSIASGLPNVEADSKALKQILLNLLSNAVKFTDSGGKIRVDVWSTETEVCVAVADTGKGIAADRIDCIFEPFVQLQKAHEVHAGSSELPDKGWGLGLAIAHSLVEQHDGYLTVDSAEGVGSTFTVRLPRQVSTDV